MTALAADCGTAVTVDCFDRNAHQGGVIAPGVSTMLASLKGNTADLPEVAVDTSLPQRWAVNTEEAIAAGCMYSVAGLLQAQRHALTVDEPLQCFISGGDAKLLRKALADWQLDETLVLEGLRLWACQEK